MKNNLRYIILVVLAIFAPATASAQADPGKPHAVLSCDIDYVSPDGTNTVKFVNQRLTVELSSKIAYYFTIDLGVRRLDYLAYDVGQQKMVGVTLQRMTSPGVFCDSEKPNVATCAYKSSMTQERANITCRRLK